MEFLSFAAFFILLLAGTLGLIAAFRFIAFTKSGEAHIKFSERHLVSKTDDRAFERWYKNKCSHYVRTILICACSVAGSIAFLAYKFWQVHD